MAAEVSGCAGRAEERLPPATIEGLRRHPAIPYVLPFAVFIGMLGLQKVVLNPASFILRQTVFCHYKHCGESRYGVVPMGHYSIAGGLLRRHPQRALERSHWTLRTIGSSASPFVETKTLGCLCGILEPLEPSTAKEVPRNSRRAMCLGTAI